MNPRVIEEPREPKAPREPKEAEQVHRIDPMPLSLVSSCRPLPLCYGTNKVSLLVIEKYTPEVTAYPTWMRGTTYLLGSRVCNGMNVYEQINPIGGPQSGTGAGPTDKTAAPIVDGTCIWRYLQPMPMPLYNQRFAAALCEGPIAGVSRIWWDKELIDLGGTVTGRLRRGLSLVVGSDAPQSVPVLFDQCGYQHTAAVVTPYDQDNDPCSTGTKQEMPDIALEVVGLRFGETTPDASPADIIVDILTHARRGCAWSATRLHECITSSAADSYRTYCDAAGLRISMLIDRKQSALALVGTILAATNSDACWSGGELKIVPLGDQEIATPAFGSTGYVPSNTARYNLTVDDFLDKVNPVQVSRRPDADCFNSFPVEYVDREEGYVRNTVEDPDPVDAEVRGGIRRAKATSLPVTFRNGLPVTQLSRIAAHRSLKCRNQYTFTVGWRYLLLEPTDIVTLTEPGIGLSLTPVRITSTEETADGITITAEDYPAGVAAAASYAPQAGDGYTPNELVTLAHLHTVIDGVMIGVDPDHLGPEVENQARDRSNLVPNGEFAIWTPPRDKSVYPPDCWSAAVGGSLGTFTDDLAYWAAAGAGTVFYDTTTQRTADVSMVARPPSATDGTTTALRLRPSSWFPVTGGQLYLAQADSMLDVVPAEGNEPWLRVTFYEADKATPVAANILALTASATSTWETRSMPVFAPTGARWAGVSWHVPHPASGAHAGLARLDKVSVRRVLQNCDVGIADNQVLPESDGDHQVLLDNELSDDGGMFDAATNHRWICPDDGYYLFAANLALAGAKSSATITASILCGGEVVGSDRIHTPASGADALIYTFKMQAGPIWVTKGTLAALITYRPGEYPTYTTSTVLSAGTSFSVTRVQ